MAVAVPRALPYVPCAGLQGRHMPAMIKALSKIFRSDKAVKPLPSVPEGERYYVIGDIHGRCDLFEALDTSKLVFKRQVGGGAHGQFLLEKGEPMPGLECPMMVQPYLETIEHEGELSFIFIDGQLSHALLKRAAPGDYRIQSLYGGTETVIVPNQADIRAARAVLETLEGLPLYARVDMLRGDDGKLLLMELELIEPYLYPQEGPGVGRMMADALVKRL